ncbi:MAG TPA: beta-L-arabinofuranosidase domain-containing protein [Balneolales bacterium]|nr:beta-L-arabinofuranosidase domain-containing protein [Balneolales bacterium]HYX09846.1 beta-L-arabinofuranosidase domain-containing protein [Bacteroidales bacterium]
MKDRKPKIRYTLNMNILLLTIVFGLFFHSNISGNVNAFIHPHYRLKEPSPGTVKIQTFPLSDVRILSGPFKRAMKNDEKYMLELKPDKLLAPFFKSAGLKPKAKDYGGWETYSTTGHTLGSYLSALSMMYAATGNSKLLKRVNYIVKELGICQKAHGDGYVGPIPGGEKVWNEIKNGKIDNTGKAHNIGGKLIHTHHVLNGVGVPWYNLHKTFMGLRDAYWYANNDQAKNILIQLGNWAVNLTKNLTDAQFDKMLLTEYGGMNEAMADIYEITGKKKYLKLAERFNDKRIFHPLVEGKDSLAGFHANTQIPKIIGAAKEYEVDGSSNMEKVADYFWRDVTGRRIYVNGEMGVHEYFGKLGQLPNRLAKSSGETCNVFNMLKLTRHLMQWKPVASYADYYERALYNDILASQDPKTGMMTYFISMKPGFFKTFSQPFDSFWCCVCTGMENHAKYGKVIYMHTDNSLFVNLFIPSSLNWKKKGITVLQKTKFPESQRSTLTLKMSTPKKMTMYIRRPYWAKDGYAIQVNGRTVKNISKPSSYIAVNRTWHNGDKIRITLPMKLHISTMANDSNKFAIMDGPIVLAGELGGYIANPYAKQPGAFFNLPAVSVPKLAVNDKPVNEWLKPVPGKPLHFKTVGVGKPKDVKLAPFYEITHQHYTIYWDKASTD